VTQSWQLADEMDADSNIKIAFDASHFNLFVCDSIFEAPSSLENAHTRSVDALQTKSIPLPGTTNTSEPPSYPQPTGTAVVKAFVFSVAVVFEAKNAAVSKLDASSFVIQLVSTMQASLPTTGVHGKFVLKWLQVRNEPIVRIVESQPLEVVLALLAVDLMSFFEEKYSPGDPEFETLLSTKLQMPNLLAIPPSAPAPSPKPTAPIPLLGKSEDKRKDKKK